MEIEEYCFDIALIGNLDVGKTSLVYRYLEGTFDYGLRRDIQINYRLKKMEIDSKKVKMRI